MTTRFARVFVSLLAVAAAYFTSGCAAFRASTSDLDVNKTQHVGSTYDYSDLRTLSQTVADELLASPFLADKSPAPIMMIAGVQNRTSRYVDTKGLTDKMRTLLFQSGKLQFVNEARREDLLKEQGYQAANATPETQTAVGKQLGAKYMMSGSLIEMQEGSPRQVRVSKQEYTYYKLTIEVTDLETGLLAWTTEKEFARQTSLPLIGW
jgi:penicillin-binding protein activator